VAISDLNGDGNPDLAIANGSSSNISILLGDGTGSFAAAQNFPVGTSPASVAISDLNGDGNPDLAIANGGSFTNPGAVSILLGDGTGSFAAAQNFGTGLGPRSVAISDLNGDGNPDLAIANGSSSNISILLGDGTGSFAAAQNFGAGIGVSSVAVSDLNGDGKPDLAATIPGLLPNPGNVSVLLHN